MTSDMHGRRSLGYRVLSTAAQAHASPARVPVVGNRDLLTEALAALRAGARSPGLSRRIGGGLEENATDRLDLLGGCECEGGADRRWTSERV
jgi:hypothetical protein